MKDCLKKTGLDDKQARRIMHDMSVWLGFFEGKCNGRCPGDEPLTLTRFHNCELPQVHEAFEGQKSVCG